MDYLKECPSCGSTRYSERYVGRSARNPEDPRSWRVDGCHDCGLGFLNPQPTWEELEPFYSSKYSAYEKSHGAAGSDKEVVAEAFEKKTFRHLPIPTGKRVLDVGCGGGYFLRICSKLGATVQGVEPSPIAAKQACEQGIKVFNGMLDDFETDERFDVITMSQVLEHVPNPVGTLTKLKALLAPDGMIWIAVPNAECKWSKLLGWRWDGADLPYHLLHFGPKSVSAAAEKANLTVSRIYTNSEPWIVAFSLQKYLKTRFAVPAQISSFFITKGWATRKAQEMDGACSGDNLMVELKA